MPLAGIDPFTARIEGRALGGTTLEDRGLAMAPPKPHRTDRQDLGADRRIATTIYTCTPSCRMMARNNEKKRGGEIMAPSPGKSARWDKGATISPRDRLVSTAKASGQDRSMRIPVDDRWLHSLHIRMHNRRRAEKRVECRSVRGASTNREDPDRYGARDAFWVSPGRRRVST